jgi:hypothetical protein
MTTTITTLTPQLPPPANISKFKVQWRVNKFSVIKTIMMYI